MTPLLKSLLALLLGLGFLALETRAQAAPEIPRKPVIAFLGMAEGSDPQVREAIAKRIRRELGADTEFVTLPGEEVAKLFAKGILREPDARPEDPQALRRAVGEAYFAYGSLEPISVASKRVWWKPWSVKSTWTQGLRLHVVEGPAGPVIFDALVPAARPETGFLFAPEGEWGKVPPLEREKRLRLMAETVSVEAAKALAKVVKDRVPSAPSAAVPADPG